MSNGPTHGGPPPPPLRVQSVGYPLYKTSSRPRPTARGRRDTTATSPHRLNVGRLAHEQPLYPEMVAGAAPQQPLNPNIDFGRSLPCTVPGSTTTHTELTPPTGRNPTGGGHTITDSAIDLSLRKRDKDMGTRSMAHLRLSFSVFPSSPAASMD
jgi:hypothetical protein